VIGAEPCPVGTFSPAGAGVCYACPAGLTTQVRSCKLKSSSGPVYCRVCMLPAQRAASPCLAALLCYVQLYLLEGVGFTTKWDAAALPPPACSLSALQGPEHSSAEACLAPPGVGYYTRGLLAGF
jgi:hypothetical protein